MKNRFFHQEQGKTLGPIDFDEMKKRIRSGRIRLFDLIYLEGEAGWKMALEHPKLRDEFKDDGKQKMQSRPWVCLQRKSDSGFDFGTSGPFNIEEIRLAIQEGRVAYTDYVWRDGFKEWKRIGTVDEFNRRKVERKEPEKPALPPLPDIPNHELLRNVVEIKRPEVKRPEPSPSEAVIDDTIVLPETHYSIPNTPQPPSHEEPPRRRKKSSRRGRLAALMDWIIVLALALIVCGGLWTLVRYLKKADLLQLDQIISTEPTTSSKENTARPPSPKPAPPAAPAVAAPESVPPPGPEAKPKVAEKPPPPEIKNVAPTELVLNVQTIGGNQVRIDLRTDASGPDNPVYLQIVGLPGQVAEGASFYKYMKLSSKGDRKESLDLSGLKLPQGRFILRAEAGNLRKEARMNVGVTEAQFKQNVARLRKIYAHSIWKERLELFRLAGILEQQLTESLAGKKFSVKGLSVLNSVKRSNGANYILFDQWFELKEIMEAARTNPTMTLLGRSKQIKERLSTFSVWK